MEDTMEMNRTCNRRETLRGPPVFSAIRWHGQKSKNKGEMTIMRHLYKNIRDGSSCTVKALLAGALIMLAVCLPAQSVFAVGTSAGTPITNQATANYNVGASSFSETSNTTTTFVAEILDVVVTWQDAANITVEPGDTNQVLTFQITNNGNGNDDYTLEALSTPLLGDNFDPTLVDIYFDANSSGSYDAGDTQYVQGVNDPTLAADASITVFVLNSILAMGLSDGDLGDSQLTATSNTPPAPGPWVAGTIVAGAGEVAGTDAVVGTSTGTANERGTYVVSSVVVTLVKSVTIADPFGGPEPVPGATMTYAIVVSVTGTGTALGVIITDLIPLSTTYSAGTLNLNSGALTDAGGDDVGDVGATTAGEVTVSLGDLAALSPVQTITFDVTID